MSAGSERAYAFATPSTGGTTASFSGSAAGRGRSTAEAAEGEKKPPFRPAPDDTKPVLRDPISRSDPVETSRPCCGCRPSPNAEPRLDDSMVRIVLPKSLR